MFRLHLTIYGHVQGVFFRESVRELASSLGVVGEVKNVEDAVQVMAEGEKRKLRELRDWCARGPELARVDRVEEHWQEINRLTMKEFSIKL